METLNPVIKNFLERNSQQTINKFIDKLQSPLTEADDEGHVYGYIPRGSGMKLRNFKMKLGRTEKTNPNERVIEWGGEMVFSVRTVCNRKLERLVHLIFNRWHIDVFNNLTGKNELEWFYFNENIPVNTIVSMLNDHLNTLHEVNISHPHVATVHVAPIVPVAQISPILLNINTASKENLCCLPGIGKELSQRILDFRKSKKFCTIFDLKKIKGIGNGTFNKCEKLICV